MSYINKRLTHYLDFYIVEFTYCLNPEDEKPILLINTHIGIKKNEDGSEDRGVIGADFLREMQELERLGKKECEIWFNTGGGSVKDGWDIYGAIQQSKMHVVGLNIGIAASTGGWDFQACHERIMMDYSLLMMHPPHGGSEQGQAEFTESIAIMLSSKAHKTKAEVLELMKAKTFMTAATAKANGFCDEVRTSGANVQNATPDIQWIWNKGNEVYNNILLPGIKPKTENKMKELILFLNTLDAKLPENATAEAVLDAVKKVGTTAGDKTVNAATVMELMLKMQNDWKEDRAKLEGERDELKKKMDEAGEHGEDNMDDEIKEMKFKYDEMCDRLKKMEDEHKAEAEARENDDCQNAISEAVKAGRVNNTPEAMNYWKETGKTVGAKSLKNLLTTLPVNKEMPFEAPKDFADIDAANRTEDMPATSVYEWKNKFGNEFASNGLIAK